jgi:TRAP-type C4-dicarboxylate transport system permease small subunit
MADTGPRPGTGLGRRAYDVLVAAEKWAGVLLLLVILVATFGQVVARFVFDSPFFWTEELARYCYVWLSFVGSVYVMSNRSHIVVEVGEEKLGRLPRLALNLFGLGGVVVASLMLAFGSTESLIELSHGASPALGIPTWVFYGVVYVSFIGIAFHAVGGMVRLVLDHRAGDDVDPDLPRYVESAI